MIYQFLQRLTNSKQPLALPTKFSAIYAKTVEQLLKKYPNSKRQIYPLDDGSIEAIIGHFYRLFSTHCLKFFQTLISIELDALKANKTCNVLGWSHITFLDIGCGAGAASIALLALLEEYQHFLENNNKAISPINVQFVGIEPEREILKLYGYLVEEYGIALHASLIHIHQDAISRAFPQVESRLLQRLTPANSHLVILGMSNVIRPLGNAFRDGRTAIAEQIRCSLSGENFQNAEFGVAEANAFQRILEGWNLDNIGLLSIATSNKDRETGKSWHEHLREMIHAIQKTESSHTYQSTGIQSKQGFFKSLPGASRTGDFKSRYYYNYLTLTNSKYLENKEWVSITSIENLELAWVRTRQNIQREALIDEIELRLFDYNVEDKLERLRRQVLSKNWSSLNLENALYFEVPKKATKNRPKALNRIEEQILATAVIQKIGSRAESFQKHSYSYHLNTLPTEFLYEYWLKWWKNFINSSIENVKSRYALRADIEGFYEHVEQDLLLKIIKRTLQISDKTHELLSKLLKRDCGERHEPGLGLPQGHIASGFWADIYLAQLYPFFSSLPGVSFIRYADDMVFAIDGEEEANETKRKLKIALDEELQLKTAEDKTFPQSGADYIAQNALDALLDTFQEERITPVVNQIYRLSEAYKRLYKRREWEFISLYRQLLEKLSIYVSDSWLRRKIEQFSYLPPGKIKFPALSDSLETGNWVEHFQQTNGVWLGQLNQLRVDLKSLFFENLHNLKHDNLSDHSKLQAGRRLNFAANRLCMIGLEKVAETLLNEMLESPWHFRHPDTLCRGLANTDRLDLLLKLFEQASEPYIKAIALRSFARIPSEIPIEIINLLINVLKSKDTSIIEKMKASEALLHIDNWETLDIQVLQDLIEKENNPYLLKNYVLLLGRAFPEDSKMYLLAMRENSTHLIINDAVEYILKTDSNLLHQIEPGILYTYYSSDYPVTEDELRTQNDSPPFGV